MTMLTIFFSVFVAFPGLGLRISRSVGPQILSQKRKNIHINGRWNFFIVWY